MRKHSGAKKLALLLAAALVAGTVYLPALAAQDPDGNNAGFSKTEADTGPVDSYDMESVPEEETVSQAAVDSFQSDPFEENTAEGNTAEENTAIEDVGTEEDPVPAAVEEEDRTGMSPDNAGAEETTLQEIDPEETGTQEISPEETTLQETDPEETGMQEIGPEETIPLETIPEEDDPQETDPEEMKPEQSASGETIPEGTILAARGNDQTYVPADTESGTPENDDIFAAYVNRELGLDDEMKTDTGSDTAQSSRCNSNYASNRLTGYNRTAYGLLLEKIRKVARGKLTSTEFALSMDKLGLDKVKWTAKDLGVSSIIKSGEITEAALNAADKKIGIDLESLHFALTADCPYDLYWYDVTQGVWISGIWYEACYTGSEWVLYPTDTIDFGFAAAKEYSAANKEGTYRVNAQIGASVTKAYENAHSIVEKYKDLSDYQKLDHYRQEIQNAVVYNEAAASDDDISYGNPWQLIWVFDDDPETNVVCEGYSKAFQYLCDISKFSDLVRETICVTGKAFGGDHMWNIVILNDGRSYLCDITNCEEGAYEPGKGGAFFMVGVQDTAEGNEPDPLLATGSMEKGYTFDLTDVWGSTVAYLYDAQSFSNFSENDLTLAAGRVTEETTTDQVTAGRHIHLFVFDPIVPPTYTKTGKTAGSHCAICGKVKVAQEEIPKLIYVSSLKLNKTSATLIKNNTVTLKAAASPSNASKKTVKWTSSNPAIARVNSKGLVRGVGKGTATITATAADGSKKTASCKITVKVPVTGVKCSKTTASVLKGKTMTLKAVVSPSDAGNKAVTWKSSNTKVATVNAKGVVKGISGGTATITVTTKDGAKKAACRVTVKIPVSGIRFRHSTYRISKGKKKTLSWTITPSNAANKKVTFTSSDPKIATVTSSGQVKGIKKGNVTITATAADGSGVKGTCTVKIR